MTDSIAEIVQAHRSGTDPLDTIRACYARIRAHDDHAIFITLRPEDEALIDAGALKPEDRDRLPLFGVPFVVKDNIDVAELPTTAACPAFARVPERSAVVVEKLTAAGAIVIGKTNLDQFATGLVGVRSPYGVPRNARVPAWVPGGSSSGSAVAVGAGLVPFALGTDTAGSGRVPAALNGIVGLKPSVGLLSSTGMLPACRTLDTISVFARDVAGALAVLEVAEGFDASDPFSRRLDLMAGGAGAPGLRIGVPDADSRIFLGDRLAQAAFDAALRRLEQMGAVPVPIDLAPFFAVARLLYEGPWVAERYAAVEDLLTRDPEAFHPVTRRIIEGASRFDAVATFKAFYRLAELKRATEAVWQGIEALVVPSIPRPVTLEEVDAEPVLRNSELGTYTNFVNLLDLCALAVPGPERSDGTPAGITWIAPAGRDLRLACLGAAFLGEALPARPVPSGSVPFLVVGAHLSGLPLNPQITGAGGVFLEEVETAPHYRFYALPGGPPHRPGLIRVGAGQGASIAGELWALPDAAFGRFVTGIPAPLGIGKVTLADGRVVAGFICEGHAAEGAEDITSLGGWRAFLAQGGPGPG
ncbi:MAG TPA: allophanate hydrolase [Geminicoccus sp.]|jgi:allophanate hydrolase|uniref:allophanate hydrolase n=1 Tax=Geminicoccus sp. TaxID=2024832 RepID=UPI002E312965|nr:allophanate hydrolase [Geminicoccus sp.]HEX2526701.1 allophanate hydrolase [Geminicoccus sp.]